MNEIVLMITEMAPYLLLGFLMAGVMHSFVPARFYSHYLAGSDFHAVLCAALMGVPLPLCSCGVLPTAMSLRKEGASRGATTSFLIATPQTGVDSIAATFSLMGLPMAIIRPVAALLTALLGGSLTNALTHSESDKPTADDTPSGTGCQCHHGEAQASDLSLLGKAKEAVRYAFVDMIDDIGKWLVIGLVVAALITVLVPDDFFAAFAANSWLSMLLVLAISIPMYVCATGSIPIAVALMIKGLTPGAALVLLMAGPAANAASILVIRNRLGTRALIGYLTAIIGGAIACGLLIDYAMPREWFTGALVAGGECCEQPSWFEWACTGLLAALLLFAAWRQINHNDARCSCHKGKEDEKHGDCCCHNEEEEEKHGDCCCHKH